MKVCEYSPCVERGATFQLGPKMREHILLVHKDKLQYECEGCGWITDKTTSLASHKSARCQFTKYIKEKHWKSSASHGEI